jgi:hypothetical protein
MSNLAPNAFVNPLENQKILFTGHNGLGVNGGTNVNHLVPWKFIL